jgi:hypothetical protein
MIPYKTNEDKDKPNMLQMRLDGMTEIKIHRANISWVICRVYSTYESIYLWWRPRLQSQHHKHGNEVNLCHVVGQTPNCGNER